MLNKAPISSGMLEVSELLPKSRNWSSVSCEMDDGILPSKLLWQREMSCRWWRSPSASGMFPCRELSAKLSSSSLERLLMVLREPGLCRLAHHGHADMAAWSSLLHARRVHNDFDLGGFDDTIARLKVEVSIAEKSQNGSTKSHSRSNSESAEFAQLCETEGLTFIGPPASAIRDMGDKRASKRIMGAAGVPLVPGYHGDNQDMEFLKAEAEKIGYPILIKPTHGGGGKGMRVFQGPEEFVESFLGAQREAAASFGINTVLLEKYITKPRHVEVQVFGDKHGNVIHLYERDCSVQRRHQKIIEEAPAPNVIDEFRSHLGSAAVSAAKAVGYHNAGTVEFILDTTSSQFYFMEMNTRLQVEHPVTEMVVGQDLVEWQIRVANGEPLPLTQPLVPLNGHAFEARIYAENVPRGFLPATGTLFHYRPVSISPSVRVETGVEAGDSVSIHYDPMIAKLVVWGENRNMALTKLKNCLINFQVAGLPTNVQFLHRLANHWAFEAGLVETHFIEHFKNDLFIDSSDAIAAQRLDSAKLGAAIAAACISEKTRMSFKETLTGRDTLLSQWYSHPPFRMHHFAKRVMEFEWDKEVNDHSEELFKLVLTHRPEGGYFIEIEDGDSPGLEIKVTHLGDDDFRVDADGMSMNVTLSCYSKDTNKNVQHIHIWHGKHHHEYKQTLKLERSTDDGSQHKPSNESVSHPKGSVLAPMAGLVVKVLVENGALVQKNQPVLVLEAMKMEHVVRSPSGGYVHGLQVAPGQQVFDMTALFSIKDNEDA